MNLPVPGDGADAQGRPPAPRGKRPVSRKTLDEIFGEVLPGITGDELDDRAEQACGDADRDQWYRDNTPPHHG
jgi:hypothetical protein